MFRPSTPFAVCSRGGSCNPGSRRRAATSRGQPDLPGSRGPLRHHHHARRLRPETGTAAASASGRVRLGRRGLVWINVTANPTAEWLVRQITAAFPWDEAPRYLIRDRDRIYSSVVTRRLRAMGIRDKPTAPASPWQNGFAERLIGSIRRECVDHIIVLGEAHLRRILRSYARYCNEIRTHRSLDKDAPVTRPVQRVGIISSRAVLGGLHHRYARV